MPRTVKAIIGILMCIFAGCTSTLYQYYDYKENKVQFGQEEATISLNGRSNKDNENRIVKIMSPYYLHIIIISKNIFAKKAKVSNLRIIDYNTGNTLFLSNGILENIFNASPDDKKLITMLFLDKISIPFNKCRISFDLELIFKNKVLHRKIDIILEKHYHEEHGTFWDKMMSV